MNGSLHLLLVENDPIDVKTVRRALSRVPFQIDLQVAGNGHEALQALEGYELPQELPDLILLDLNMPFMTGIEFLQAIKSRPRFRMIPVVVLTTSYEEEDLEASYGCGAAGYIIKPADFDQFVNVVSTVGAYWSINERYGRRNPA